MAATDRAQALCEGCGRRYRVPDPSRSYKCKACGGTVRVPAVSAEPDELEGTIACPKCRAINVHDAHFCAECGGVLGPSKPPHHGEAAMEARREANDALRRGYAWIGAITWLYRLGVLAYALVTVFAIGALARADVPLEGGVLVVGVTALLTVLMLMGTIQLLFRPFLWTVVIAVVASGVAALHYVGPNPLGLMFLWTVAWAALFWAAVLPTRRFRRLIEEHKDLYILHHASRQTKRSLEGRSAHERHERLLGVMRRAGLRAWKVSLAAAVTLAALSAFGTYTVVTSFRPQELGAATAQFEAAWNERGVEGVEPLFLGTARKSESERLAAVADGHGWRAALPTLSAGRAREEDGEHTWIDYELAEGTLSAGWDMHGREWVLVQLELPPPPIEPTFERFLTAWRESDAKAIAGFFPASYQEQMLASIRRTAERREWETFPEILRSHVDDPSEGRAPATVTLASGNVTMEWRLRGSGRWGLHSLQFPKR